MRRDMCLAYKSYLPFGTHQLLTGAVTSRCPPRRARRRLGFELPLPVSDFVKCGGISSLGHVPPSEELWLRMCAELIAFPGTYEKYTSQVQARHMLEGEDSNVVPIAPRLVVERANVTEDFTVRQAAHELARQGVTVPDINDAQPFGFYWLLDNMRHPSMSKDIACVVRKINLLSPDIVSGLSRFEPQVWHDTSPPKMHTEGRTRASSSKALAR